jgi:hypothetical protein
VPISPDFISWRTKIDNYNRFIIENTPKYVVNCEHPLQIKYHKYFVTNYYHRLKRNKQRDSKFVYKPPVIEKDKLLIPAKIREQCFVIKTIKRRIQSSSITPYLKLTFIPSINSQQVITFNVNTKFTKGETWITVAKIKYKTWNINSKSFIKNIIKENVRKFPQLKFHPYFVSGYYNRLRRIKEIKDR